MLLRAVNPIRMNAGPPRQGTPNPPVIVTLKRRYVLLSNRPASQNDLPLAFFARVIWQESRFQSQAVGPITRTGQRAQGIAQFMPGTARERGLLDPFNPVQALPKSAEFLNELREPVRQSGTAPAAVDCRSAARRNGSMECVAYPRKHAIMS